MAQPLRLMDLKHRLSKHGVTLKEDGGKHPYYFFREGYSVYPVPAHNGLKSEIDGRYVRAVCRHFGINHEDLV